MTWSDHNGNWANHDWPNETAHKNQNPVTFLNDVVAHAALLALATNEDNPPNPPYPHDLTPSPYQAQSQPQPIAQPPLLSQIQVQLMTQPQSLPHIQSKLSVNLVNFKNALQEHFQKKGVSNPIYHSFQPTLEAAGVNTKLPLKWQCTVELHDSQKFTSGSFPTKKQAEQDAAHKALDVLRESGALLETQLKPPKLPYHRRQYGKYVRRQGPEEQQSQQIPPRRKFRRQGEYLPQQQQQENAFRKWGNQQPPQPPVGTPQDFIQQLQQLPLVQPQEFIGQQQFFGQLFELIGQQPPPQNFVQQQQYPQQYPTQEMFGQQQFGQQQFGQQFFPAQQEIYGQQPYLEQQLFGQQQFQQHQQPVGRQSRQRQFPKKNGWQQQQHQDGGGMEQQNWKLPPKKRQREERGQPGFGGSWEKKTIQQYL